MVMVPEIPEWRSLYLAPEKAAETVAAAVLALAQREEVATGRIGVMGNSFGVPQALRAAGDPGLREHLRAVAGFGGYCSLPRALHFVFVGEHDWNGRHYQADPDPYGRWVVTGNYLTQVPGLEEADDVAEALLDLARHAGDIQVGAWHERFDPLKRELEARIHPSRRDLFRAVAPEAGTLPPAEFSSDLAAALARAGEELSPLFRPASLVDDVSVPVRLIHGREDRMIPFTESLRLQAAFPPSADARVDLTGLLAHSRKDGEGAGEVELLEQLHMLRTMANLLGLL
jgi:pimeloyl-ACP methyl ester carboxylesterase